MAERTVELDTPVLTDPAADALREAIDRADRAEAELARLKAHPPVAHAHKPSADAGNLFDTAEPVPDTTPDTAKRVAAKETAAAHTESDADRAAAKTSTPSRTPSAHAMHPADDAVHTDALKQPPTPSTAANAPGDDDAATPAERGSADRATAQNDGVDELRKDPMMAHLLDSLDAGTDVGHYGRLVFAMVARHFLPHAEVVGWMTKDRDFSEEQAQQMLHQVEGRDYNPPRRERLLQWQKEQEFQFMNTHDPDSGNLYRNLEFPKEVYDHIGHYQEAKASE